MTRSLLVRKSGYNSTELAPTETTNTLKATCYGEGLRFAAIVDGIYWQHGMDGPSFIPAQARGTNTLNVLESLSVLPGWTKRFGRKLFNSLAVPRL